MKLYYMRHGQSQANVANVYAPGKLQDNDPAAQLTDLGRRQAREAGAKASGIAFTRIISSDLHRALETARIVAETIGFPAESIMLEPRLRELRVGTLSGTNDLGIAGYLAHQAHPELDPTVETQADAERRLREFLASLQTYADDTILLVSHGGTGMILRSLLTHDARPLDQQPDITNTELFQLPDPLGAQV